MARDDFVDYIMDILSSYGNIRSKRMFGGYGIYMQEVIFAIIINNEIYFKADDVLAEKYKAAGSVPFTYERAGKLVSLNYWAVPAEVLEDDDLLRVWVNDSVGVSRVKGKKK